MNDVRAACRTLLKNPGFALIAIVTLALGTGLNTAMFSVLNAMLLQPPPYPEGAQLVRVLRTAPQTPALPHAVPDYLDYQEQNSVFAGIAAFSGSDLSLAEEGQPAERLRALGVTANFFAVVGVQPMLGRAFSEQEDRMNPKVALLTHGFWQRRFGGDASVVGRTMRIGDESIEVVGVLSPQFDAPLLWGRVDLVRPSGFSPGMRMEASRNNRWLQVVARLKPGVTLARAQVEMSAIAARLATAHPATHAQNRLRLVPLRVGALDETGQRVLWLTATLSGCVLLIACTNLANLQLARLAARARDQAIRIALGATRLRLMRELAIEGALLALVGGTLGWWLAEGANRFIATQWVVAGQPGIAVETDPAVMGFSAIALGVAVLSFGLLPAWLGSRANVADALKQGGPAATAGRARVRLRHGLIVAEVGLALVLLSGAALFLRGLERFMARDPGWRAEGLLTASLTLPNSRYMTGPSDAKRRIFFDQLLERTRALPGVEQAALAVSLPVWDYTVRRQFVMEGAAPPPPGREPLAYYNSVTPDFFAALRIPLKRGRPFAAEDRMDAPAVAIVNETMARTLWPGENPLGKRLRDASSANPGSYEIVGVAGDVQLAGNLNRPESAFQIYRPLAQDGRGVVALALRTRGAPEAWAAPVRDIVAQLDAALPVNDLAPASQAIGRLLANHRLSSRLLGGFAGLGLLLAALGIYGVVTAFVAQRTREIGVRLAVGARRRDVLRLVFGHGLRLAAWGIAGGLPAAWALGRALAQAAPQLPDADFTTIGGVALLLGGMVLLACAGPARRAARIDPVVALRAE